MMLDSDAIFPQPLETSINSVGGHFPDRNSDSNVEQVHLNASMLDLQTSAVVSANLRTVRRTRNIEDRIQKGQDKHFVPDLCKETCYMKCRKSLRRRKWSRLMQIIGTFLTNRGEKSCLFLWNSHMKYRIEGRLVTNTWKKQIKGKKENSLFFKVSDRCFFKRNCMPKNLPGYAWVQNDSVVHELHKATEKAEKTVFWLSNVVGTATSTWKNKSNII